MGPCFSGVAVACSGIGRSRSHEIFLGIVSALAGVVLMVSPLKSAAVLTVLGGVWLLVVSVVEIVTAFQVRSRARHLPTGD